jgi:ribosomal protein S18 acetylase RimI-like enzyme
VRVHNPTRTRLQSQCDAEDRDIVPPPPLGFSEQEIPHVVYVLTVGVMAEYRQGGLATRLVRNLIARVESDLGSPESPRCSCIYLHVLTTNVPAIRFYEKLGFKKHKLLPG